MRLARDFVPQSTSGNTSSVAVAADPEAVWQALHDLRFRDLRVSGLLMGIRSLPARLLKRGSLSSSSGGDPKMIESMVSSRFIELYSEAPEVLTLGVVGQFWKLSGGTDAGLRNAAGFVAFDEPGFIKSAIDFVLEPGDGGTRVSTHTCNSATDDAAAKRFGAYWRVVGGGSKLIRLEILRAVRRAAEADVSS